MTTLGAKATTALGIFCTAALVRFGWELGGFVWELAGWLARRLF
jgi:hypothetical protein